MAQKFTVPITVKQLASAGSDAVTVYVDADTYARLKLEAGGRLVWGSGSGAGDTNLYRDEADTLKTDDNFKVGGKLSVIASSGDEGGEIYLAPAQTNSTLSGGVTIDVYQNKIRFFEQGGSARGAYIDLTATTGGAGTNLLAGTGSGGATTLDGLSDVTAPTPTSGDFLKWNGTAWVNDPINLGTDTVGNYVASLVAGNNITLSNNSGEGSTPTINSGMTISDTIPSSPTNGQVWYESDTGKTFVYYDSFWIEVVGSTGAQGPQGAQGATGATGSQGAAGIIASSGVVSGEYYGTAVTTITSLTTTNQVTYYSPIYVSESMTFDRIACRTGSTFSGTATVRLGVYNNSGGKPSTVKFDAGTVSCTAATTTYTITISQTLDPGWYWLAQCTQGAATTNNFVSSTTLVISPPLQRFNASLGQQSGWTESGISGAFATAGTVSTTGNLPLVALRNS